MIYPSRGGVAQLVRASACHAEGREFEPLHSRHFRRNFLCLFTICLEFIVDYRQKIWDDRERGNLEWILCLHQS